MSPKGKWLRMLLAECPSSRFPGRGRSQGVEGHACKPPGQSQACGLCCHLHPGLRGVGSWPLPRGPHLHPLAPGLGVRTWIPRPFSASRVAILGAFAWLLMRQMPCGGASHFQHVPRPTCLLPVSLSPTPSPDGLCQASSAASLMPEQLLGQGHVRTQLARVPPSLGAAGMLGGTGGGRGGWSFHAYLAPL